MKKFAQIQPPAEVLGFDQCGIAAAVDRVVGAILDPAIRIPVIHLGLFPRGGQRLDGDRFRPFFQLVIQRKGDLVPPRALPMIDHGRFALFGEKPGAAEHAVPGRLGGQRCRMPFPMDHVAAGDVGERKPFLVVVDVVQVIPTFVVKGGIGIRRDRTAGARMGQVIREPRPRRVRRHGRCFASGDHLHGGHQDKEGCFHGYRRTWRVVKEVGETWVQALVG